MSLHEQVTTFSETSFFFLLNNRTRAYKTFGKKTAANRDSMKHAQEQDQTFHHKPERGREMHLYLL
jgi:hypothetical protein